MHNFNQHIASRPSQPRIFDSSRRQIQKMNTEFAESLMECVSTENNMEALLRMIPRVGIDVPMLQSMMQQFIGNLNENSARKALFNVKPIHQVLPLDILRHVATFNDPKNLRVINKSFQKYYDRNQDIGREAKADVVQESTNYFRPKIDHNEQTNEIFIIQNANESSTEFVKRKKFGKRVSFHHDLAECADEAASCFIN